MVNDEKVLAKEFLYRYQILKSKSNDIDMEKFFSYTQLNPNFISCCDA